MLSQLRVNLRPARRPLNRLLRTRMVSALVTPHRVDDYLELIDPIWSVQAVRAQVVQFRDETRRAVSIWLQPNELWAGFRAGQYVRLTVRNRGVQHVRCFSISSAPEDGLPLRVTIQTVVDGQVSEWARQHVERGDIVELSQAAGDFVLPIGPVPRLSFITAGSGLTPVMSMARQLAHMQHAGEIYWLHYSRDEVLLADELCELESTLPGLRLIVVPTGRRAGCRADKHFSETQLRQHVPGYETCETYACGPHALLDAVTALYAERGLSDKLHTERFVAVDCQHPQLVGV